MSGDLLRQSSGVGKSFDPWNAVRLLRGLTTSISKEYVHSYEDALSAVVPLMHQQMPWSDDTFSRIARYGQIYQHPPLAQIIRSVLGLSLSDWLKLGLAVYGCLERSFWSDRSSYLHLPGLDGQAVQQFFALTASPIEDLRTRIRSNQSYDRQWSHAFNPLRERPITFFEKAPHLIFSPVPQLVIWRVTDGLYYDLVNVGKPFAKAFGDACELYVGKVLKRALKGCEVEIHGERPYDTGDGRKAGVDWLVSDHSGHLFVECKAKRMTFPAKITGSGEPMDKDLRVLADYIIQNYKNIRDAMRGNIPDFASAGLPIFSAIVTLEDWWLLTPQLKERLHSLVEDALQRANLPISMVVDYPYKLLSFFQLERLAQDMANRGITKVFNSDEANLEIPYRGCLFPETLAELMPDIAQQADLNRFR